MKVRSLIALAVVAGAAASANALTFECRFVEQTGPAAGNFVVLPGNTITDAGIGGPLNHRRIRLQFRVVDDASGPAPAGGFVGENVGTLTVSGPVTNSNETRTPGRLNPFAFAAGVNSNGNPPLPGGDPFTMLTDLDNTQGTQGPLWQCNPDGSIPAQPPAVVRGRNTFVSIFEFTIDPIAGAESYTVTAGGMLIAATSWLTVGNPTPPDCGDPDDTGDDQVGSITYAPFPTDPVPFTCVLNVNIIPAPGAAALLGLGGLLVARRRRA